MVMNPARLLVNLGVLTKPPSLESPFLKPSLPLTLPSRSLLLVHLL